MKTDILLADNKTSLQNYTHFCQQDPRQKEKNGKAQNHRVEFEAHLQIAVP